jgi:alpha-tubulin suppressor-like RCC1 family protein
MALNFPDNPITNSYYTDTTSGFTYQYNGTAWISVGSTATTQIKELDNISGSFDNATQTFSLTIAGSPVYPVNINQITINLGGILQNAGDDFTISGDEITFTTPPASGLTFAGMFYGSSISLNSPTSGSIGTAALSTGGPIWNIGGDVTVAGIVTVGSSSVTIDGPSNELRVGTGATINESGIVIGGSGIVTATTFYGDGSNLDGITAGIGTTGSVNTTGIITASFFYGAGIGLTNIGGPLNAIAYSPGIGATGVGATSNIVVTFNKPVKINSGTITLREGAVDGSITESFDVTSTDRITISGGVVTIDPTSDLGVGTSYYVVFPADAYKDILDTTSTVGITSYYFETAAGGGGFFASGNTSLNALNDAVPRSSPTQIPGIQWSKVTADQVTASALRSDGTLWNWGSGQYGALGQNDEVPRSSPIQVPGTQWTDKFDSGFFGIMAIKTDGTLWGWGLNDQGQLGQNIGNPNHRSSPVQIPGTQWNNVAQRYISLATKTDGTLWAWGYGYAGTLGINRSVNHSSPTQIPGTQWNKFDVQGGVSLATKTDGTLWAWGNNGYGGLGLNDNIAVDRSSPTQIPGTQWDSVSTNYSAGFATKTDGTLWAWGANDTVSSRLGLNDQVHRSSPTQIPGTEWQSLVSGQNNTFATKTDGTLWAWGLNTQGQFGINDTIPRSSPHQIPGTYWSTASIALSNSNSLYILP